jgi:hypothetical protein
LRLLDADGATANALHYEVTETAITDIMESESADNLRGEDSRLR